MAKVTRERFDAARERYKTAAEQVSEASIALHVKYGPNWSSVWLSAGERKRFERLTNARVRAATRFITLLEGAPRDWMRGVPTYWLCESLSYEDAFRPVAEPLSVSPPLAYGATEAMR